MRRTGGLLLAAAGVLLACPGTGPSPDSPDSGADMEQSAPKLPLGSPCVDREECPATARCRPRGGTGLCTRACVDEADCPPQTVCVDQTCVWTQGTVGSLCGPQSPCHPGLDCIQVPGGSFCTRECGWDQPCPMGEEARCVKLTQGDQFCLRNCQDDGDCPPELACVPLTRAPQIQTCFVDFF